MRELVTSKIVEVLSQCFILRPCNDGLDLIRIAVLEDILFHQISDQFDTITERNFTVDC